MNVSPDESRTWSHEDWVSWVREQVADLEESYLRTPALLVGAFRRERDQQLDYHGREILELLQNADDAGVDGNKAVRVKIRLTPKGVCVANSGATFDDEGVTSLLISDNSAKALRKRDFIGNRGLGFRSVLNWTRAPLLTPE